MGSGVTRTKSITETMTIVSDMSSEEIHQMSQDDDKEDLGAFELTTQRRGSSGDEGGASTQGA